jgi:hypothetical protein
VPATEPTELPPEAERLLAARPAEFVAERTRIASELRAAGRADDARAVAALRKPTGVVLAVNRGARDRPQAASDAATAAVRVRDTQLAGDPDAYREALQELESALGLLADVAAAHLSGGRAPSDDARRRVRDLLRAAVANDGARDALLRGALREELEAPGFSPFQGLPVTPPKRKAGRPEPRRARAEEQRAARERKLREELADAERALEAARGAEERATRERVEAERTLERLRKRLGA